MKRFCCIFLTVILGLCVAVNANAEQPEKAPWSGFSAETAWDGNEHTCVINGTVDPLSGLTEVFFYRTDVGKTITRNDSTGLFTGGVYPIRNGKFTIPAKCDRIQRGRIVGGKKGVEEKLVFDFYIMPDVTVNLNMSSKRVDIEDAKAYEFMVYAWFNRDALKYMLGFGGSVTDSDDKFKQTCTRIRMYREELDALNKQIMDIPEIVPKPYKEERIAQIIKRMDIINSRIANLIDSYLINSY